MIWIYTCVLCPVVALSVVYIHLDCICGFCLWCSFASFGVYPIAVNGCLYSNIILILIN